MSLDATTTFDREKLLDEVVTAYLKAARAGQTPDPAVQTAATFLRRVIAE